MNTSIAELFDEWGFYSDKEKQLGLDLDSTYTTAEDPIAVLIQTLGKDPDKWYHRTYLFGEVKEKIKNNNPGTIEPFAREWSEKIRSYYKNKYFLNRLKNREVSRFQQTVEDIINQHDTIKESQFPPLFKLPYFYLEDVAVETVIKDYESVKFKVSNIEDEFTFVTRVKRFGKSSDRYVRFLLQNSKKHILSVLITESNTSFPLWDYLCETNQSIQYSGHVEVVGFKGTDFKFYSIVSPAYKIRINKT